MMHPYELRLYALIQVLVPAFGFWYLDRRWRQRAVSADDHDSCDAVE